MTDLEVYLSQDNLRILGKIGLYFEAYGNSSHMVGKRIRFNKNTEIGHCVGYMPVNLNNSVIALWSMGSFSYSHSMFHETCRIGNYCSLGAGIIQRGFNHPTDRFTTSPLTYDINFNISKDTKIIKAADTRRYNRTHFVTEHDVWVGRDALISPGVTLHTGSIVAQRSNVTRDVPPYAIVGGNPAKIIKYRFPESIINKLLDSKWFEYDISSININGDMPVEQFIEIFIERKYKGDIPLLINRKLIDIFDENNISISIPHINNQQYYKSYINELTKNLHDLIIFIVSKDAHTNNNGDKELFLDILGCKKSPEKLFRYSYAAIIDSSKNVFEESSNMDSILTYYNFAGGGQIYCQLVFVLIIMQVTMFI